MKRPVVIDTETFVNATLLAGKYADTGDRFHIWLHEPHAPERIKDIMMDPGHRFITFNGMYFDSAIIAAMVAGLSSEQIKHIANRMIDNGVPAWKAVDLYSLPHLDYDHIDLMNVAPSFVGLKAYGARMHMPNLQELPVDHTKELTPEEMGVILSYCYNDVETTEALYHALKGPLDLRAAMSKLYGVDMRSKSDTQMAETAFIKRLGLRRRKPVIPSTVNYTPPGFLRFRDPGKQELLRRIAEHAFFVNKATGHIIMPEFLDLKIETATGRYQMGVGGLHSVHDKKVCHVATKDWLIYEIDAASFYPSIMVLGGMVPQNTGARFIEEYKSIYYRRLEAKKTGDKVTSETLKISLNGTFGKTAAMHSPLYSPDLMISITLTGQLTLLNLIEEIETAGASVLSANTDGIAVGVPRAAEETVRAAVATFSVRSGFEFEYTQYRVLAMKDVNNYIAVKSDRKLKAKGIYAPPDLRKNPTASICARAVGAWLAHGTPLEETIRSGTYREYVSARNVSGGGQQGDQYLGRVVRWYLTTDKAFTHFTYVKNGNKVPKTDGARACMFIEQPNGPPPEDLDYNAYLKEAARIASDVGAGEFLPDELQALIAPPPKKRKRKNSDE
jgi:hypothetical protein